MRSTVWIPLVILFSGCGPGSSPSPANALQTTDSNQPQTPRVAFTSCESDDPDLHCIGLKVVSFQNQNGATVLQETETLKLIEEMNQVWKPCKVAFQLEKYESVQPESHGFAFSPDWRNDSDSIRARFDEEDRFLIVAVGPWTHATIAVAQMPGNGPFGVLVSEKYAKNAYTVGHELGHYQGLYHLRNNANLMSSRIGPFTSGLRSSQCSIARKTNLKHWRKMLRGPAART